MAVLGIHNKPLHSPKVPSFTKGKKLRMVLKKGRRPKKNSSIFSIPMPKATPISLKPKFGTGAMIFGTNAGKGTRTVASRMRSR